MAGNDQDANAEFEDQYGIAPDASQLLVRHRESFPRELREASLKGQDIAATQALDLDKVEKAIKGDGKVLSAAVRGDYVVAVVEGSDGRTRKVAVERDKAGPTDAQVKKARDEADPGQVGQPKQRS